MLIGIFGIFGSGKSLLLSIIGCSYANDPDYLVYSNLKIKHPKIRRLEPENFVDINPKHKKAIILIDEAYAWLDSRMSMSKTNRFLSYVVLQSRKRNMDVWYSTQLSGSVDLRLRELSDIFILCSKVKVYNNITKKHEFCFIYEAFVWKSLFHLAKKTFVLPLKKAELYFPKFDTRELIYPILDLKLTKAKKT